MRNLIPLLLIFSMSSIAADQWLCIGEHGAQVRKDRERVIDSSAYQTSLKLLVDEKGVRTFGEKEFLDAIREAKGEFA